MLYSSRNLRRFSCSIQIQTRFKPSSEHLLVRILLLHYQPRHILDERLGSLLLEHDPVPERDAQLPASAKTLQSILQTVFKFQEFRSNQLEIILASTTESDVFVTMPTAGGKSLCYQIPAIYLNDKFNMVTVVVSPLLSLIHDQVAALLKLGVYVVKITNETPLRERREILQTLNGSGRKPALVYITPERLSNDDLETQKTLADLNRRHLLARLVFDESHTLSTWDFRIANQQIPSILLEQYSNVPVTALTATASPSDMGKTIKSLGMTNTRRFHQSLNRPNLEYTIKQAPLTDDFVSDIVRWIKVHEYEKQTGIIYCTSVNKCKKLANKLREACYCASKSQCKKLKQRKRHSCITAQEYHAELREKERNRVHTEWQEGRFQIVCATTAFGLGIDKPDVRFVIHRNAPTTIENYFQETGRAGRDGLPAHCLCFYSFRELEQTSISFTLKQNNGDPSQPVRMRDTAIAFADFCEEQHICRRVLLLGHFGEQFNAKDCRSRCDNCANRGNLTSQDFTAEAHPAISLVKSIQGLSSPTERRITVLQCINVLRGMGGKQKEHPLYGAWKHLSRSESFPELIFDQLLSRRALAQYAMVPAGNGKANTPYSNHAGNFGKGGKKKFYSHSYVEVSSYSSYPQAYCSNRG
ncbi:P-loop containing nucleoside triphosphate hydrolase protein [Roridomyces roridus]|uniref:DNA 3'-5' helicase n=1 Tax=Roridomyces roridus TaxID=1738132 RepID=A0AAD7CAI6_9AGAR|nr:P-loop containing nucleoside triphosphate hydrolase protein [Roridomyces roridus]